MNDNNNDWKPICLICLLLLSCVNAYTCSFDRVTDSENGIQLWKVTATHGAIDHTYITDIDNHFDTRTKFAVCDAILENTETVYCYDTVCFTLLESTFLLIN